ncbi:MAG TPA: ATP-NAD kinase family protein [Candidatus Thermoplasmatota archaeon]|nr:ATP-NAD kinase family protein [Candidatus Thermoplasmatota archaeon]
MRARRIAFLVNPVAGLGARVALKGSDGVAAEALARGARPEAAGKALRFVRALEAGAHTFLTAGAPMGEDVLEKAGESAIVAHVPSEPTTADDTREAAKALLALAPDVLVFVGGDGTAADVADAVGDRVPVLGIPAGSKMYSAVYADTPERAARVVEGFDDVAPGEVLDVDEGRFRAGEVAVTLKGFVKVPVHRAVAGGKAAGTDDEVEQVTLGKAVAEALEPGVPHVLGAGGTMMEVKRALGVDGTLLGIDVVCDGKLLVKDARERDLLALAPGARVVVSPIGRQGFVLGRGNLVVSAAVLRRLGVEAVKVVATPTKMIETPVLRVDTGDPALDAAFPRFVPVTTGPHVTRLARMEKDAA